MLAPSLSMDKPHTRFLDLTFAVSAAEAEAGAPVRFTGVAYSGGVVPAYGWMGDVAIDLAGLQNPDGDEIPVLENHDSRIEAIAGRGRIFRALSETGVAQLCIDGALTTATEAGRRIAQLMSEGFPLQLSVGMSANLRELAEPIQVNGQTLKVAAVFENPLIRECSFVPVGADPDTRVARLSLRDAAHSSIRHDKEPPMTRSAEDQALIEGLQSQLDTLKAELADKARAQRKTELSALFESVGREMPATDEALQPYLAMPAEAFAVFAADLKAVAAAKKPPADRALFAATAPARAEQQAHQQRDATLGAAVDRLIAQTTRL